MLCFKDTVDGDESDSAAESPDVPPSFSRVIYISGDKQEVTYIDGYVIPQCLLWSVVPNLRMSVISCAYCLLLKSNTFIP